MMTVGSLNVSLLAAMAVTLCVLVAPWMVVAQPQIGDTVPRPQNQLDSKDIPIVVRPDAAGAGPTPPPLPLWDHPLLRSSRSMSEACRNEAKRLCADELANLSKDRVGRCLENHWPDIKDENCKSWVHFRKLCRTDGEKAGKCAEQDTARVCLEKLDTTDVSKECADSELFRSVQLFKRFKRRTPRGPRTP